MAIILITGSSTGIGFATAEVLARSGHQVYGTMRNPQKSPQLQALADKEMLPISILPLDVDDDKSVKEAVDGVLSREGHIDVLINNAGIENHGAVEEIPLEYFKTNMETNYFGTVRCIQAVLPSMRERKSGRIINVTSISGKMYSNFHAPYCASKAAVEALSECLAQEVTPYGIKVNIVEPGVIQTPIFEKSIPVDPQTNYPNIHRFMAFFYASLQHPAQAVVVGEAIRYIIESESEQLRHTAGPDAAPLLAWRSSLSDEDWIKSASMDQESWMKGMKEGFNLDVSPYLSPA
jgi:NAD(P)-dependent dehydrogenase (short-subunit alcohol dehydrogenase family)